MRTQIFQSPNLLSTFINANKRPAPEHCGFFFKFHDCLFSEWQVEVELRAQVKHFCELTGHLPNHMDGHQHVHVLPGNNNGSWFVWITPVAYSLTCPVTQRIRRVCLQRCEKCLRGFSPILASLTHGSQWSPDCTPVIFYLQTWENSTYTLRKTRSSLWKSSIDMVSGAWGWKKALVKS